MDEARLHRVMSGEDRSVVGWAARAGLSALTPAYRGGVVVRNKLFDAGVRRGRRLGRATVSIGNLTAGGTGKTPMTIELARRLLAMGRRPAILLRGYAATEHGSDEAMEYRGALPGVPVEPDPDRVAAAARVLGASPGVDVFLLDDGFQHRRAARDLDVVLIDATRPFGYGRLLPRGLLREPASGLRRADAVIVTRVDQVTADDLAEVDDRVAALTGRPPVAHAAMRWGGVREGGAAVAIEAIRGLRVVAVCGVGNPDAFLRTLRRHVRGVEAALVFGDHHDYTVADWQRVLGACHETGCEAVVTTEKDWTKLDRLVRDPGGLRVLRPVVEVRFTHGDAAVEGLLRKATTR